MGLLLNSSASDSAAAEREVDEVASSHSLGWNGRATLALAQLHNGRPAAALNVLEQPPLAKAPPPSVVVVHAKALDATGWKDKARKEAQQLTTARLLPEERAMIAPLLAD